MIITATLIVLTGFFIHRIMNFGKKARENSPEKPRIENQYIARHEQKLADDSEYEEYIKWCRLKGEIPQPKEGFDLHRMEEYHLYKKLLKEGIGGLY